MNVETRVKVFIQVTWNCFNFEINFTVTIVINTRETGDINLLFKKYWNILSCFGSFLGALLETGYIRTENSLTTKIKEGIDTFLVVMDIFILKTSFLGTENGKHLYGQQNIETFLVVMGVL